MTLTNAIKTVEKRTGKKVQVDLNNRHFVIVNNNKLGFYPNGRITPNARITSIKVNRVGDENDYSSDYFSGSYYDNITQALKSLLQ